jgi:hypothetical protein
VIGATARRLGVDAATDPHEQCHGRAADHVADDLLTQAFPLIVVV